MSQKAEPLEINAGTLIQGYVSVGTVVVASGHLAYVDGKALLNPNMPSAMVPTVVDIAGLSPADQKRVQTECAAIRITSGGCSVKVKGQVQQMNGRFGLVATDIEFITGRG